MFRARCPICREMTGHSIGCPNVPAGMLAANDNAPTQVPTIFFDLDGVLANFDKAAEKALGTNNIYKFEFVYGQDKFWELINRDASFFSDLEKMPAADQLLYAARSSGYGIKILTALPKENGGIVDKQKRLWVAEHVGGYPVITCQTKEKPNYCKPGDLLIDDRAVNKAAWEAKGGKYIVHTDVGSTLAQMESMGFTR